MLMFYIVAKSLIINNVNKTLKEHFHSPARPKDGRTEKGRKEIQPDTSRLEKRNFNVEIS
jgi:hypothetical protein